MDEPTVASVQLQPGEKLFGRYVLERKLGQGGMGVVWLARDESLQRQAALKFLPEIVRQDRAAVEDLRDETRRCLELTHPNIVRIYDFEEDDHAAGISMEFVDGGSLSGLRTEKPDRMFETDELLSWLRDLCAALHYAHTEARVVHRDLKPANLLINSRRQLKVTDFGIARTITDSVTRVTGRDATSGTLLYMSPQQFLGKASTPADDIYSVGATMYELLTSKPPFFTGSVAAQLHAAIPPPVHERRREFGKTGQPIPEVWEEVIAACLSKEPSERPGTVQEIYDRIASGSSTRKPMAVSPPPPDAPASSPSPSPSPSTPPPPIPVPAKAGSGLAWLVAVILIVLAAGGGIGVWLWTKPKEPEVAQQNNPPPKPPPVLSGTVPTAIGTGTLVVNSAPSGASILLNEKLVGVTPWTNSTIQPGTHRVRLVMEGYEPQELAVVVASGDTRDTGAVTLTPKPLPKQPPMPLPLPPEGRPESPIATGLLPPSGPGEYRWIFPDSSIRRLTRAEISGLSKDQLWIARNEIYARHGFIFSSERGRKFSRALGRFYRPVTESDTRVQQNMNPVERANVELIQSLNKLTAALTLAAFTIVAAASSEPAPKLLLWERGTVDKLLSSAPKPWNDDAKFGAIVRALAEGYPNEFAGVEFPAGKAPRISFKTGDPIPYDDGKEKTFDQKLENPDLEDTFSQVYPLTNPTDKVPENFDPGRFRNEPMFFALYGSSESAVRAGCTSVDFCGQKVTFSKRCGAADALAKISTDLMALFTTRPELAEYAQNLGGTLNWRNVAGTQRLSNHSFAGAIDLNLDKSTYWRWQTAAKLPTFSRLSFPQPIIETFERHGFIWGGKWYHYDTMHFEYRPELIAFAKAQAKIAK